MKGHVSARRDGIVGIVCILGTLVGWASILLFLKHLVPYLDGWTTNGWRYGLSALMWLPLVIVGASKGTLPQGIWRRAIAPSVFNCLGQILYALMPYYIGPALGGFLIRMALVSSTLGAFVLFVDERLLLRMGMFWAGMCAVIGGSVGTIFLGSDAIHGATATGVLLGATSGLLFGLYGVAVRYCMRGISAMTSFSVISLYTAAGLVVVMLLRGKDHGLEVMQLSGFNWFMLVASAIIGIAICHVSYYVAIARLGVAVSTAVVQLSPFLCAIGAFIIYGETLTVGQWSSGFLMIAGAMGLLVAEQRRHRPLEAPPTTVLMDELGEAACAGDAPAELVKR
jgi:drug/metabolite transporter (DMT)-like permease